MTDEALLFGMYGAPPGELGNPSAHARQLSPLVPGSVDLGSADPGSFSAITLLAPAGTLERRFAMAQALLALAAGGALTTIAPKDKGGARMRQERQQALGLARACGGHAQIGQREQRRGGDVGQQRCRQIAVDGDGAAPRPVGRAQPAVGQRQQDAPAHRLQRMGIGNGGNQTARPLDCHVAVGRQIVGAQDVVGDQPHPAALIHQRLPLGIPSHGGQQCGCQPETA
jgi:hypothetical protein